MFGTGRKRLTAVLMMVMFAGLFAAENAAAETAAGDFSIQPIYIFKNKSGKDPFEPIFKKENLPAATNIDIASFALIGITGSGEDATSLFRNEGGGDFGYIFKDGKLYGENNTVIDDISGEIRSNEEVVLVQGDREIIFKMKRR